MASTILQTLSGVRGIAIGKVLQDNQVAATCQDLADRIFSVPTCASDLLGIAFQAFRKVVMVDIPNIGFVDSHPESNGCYDDCIRRSHEPVLNSFSFFFCQPRMIGARRKTLLTERVRDSFGCALQGDIDNRWTSWTIFQPGQQEIDLFVGTAGRDQQSQVWPVKPGVNKCVSGNSKFAADVVCDGRCGGRSESQDSLDPKGRAVRASFK